MTLKEKLEEIREKYPETYEVLCEVVPKLVSNPSNPSFEDLDQYNFWVDGILDNEDAQHLYHLG